MSTYKLYVAAQLRGIADMVEAGPQSDSATPTIMFAAHIALKDIARRIRPQEPHLEKLGLIASDDDMRSYMADYMNLNNLVLVKQKDVEKIGISCEFFVSANSSPSKTDG